MIIKTNYRQKKLELFKMPIKKKLKNIANKQDIPNYFVITLVVSNHYDVGLNFFKTFSCQLLSVNGINWILTFGCWLLCKNRISFTTPIKNSIYGIFDPSGNKILHILRIGFSHLRAHLQSAIYGQTQLCRHEWTHISVFFGNRK